MTKNLLALGLMALLFINGCATQRSAPSGSSTTRPPAPATLPPGYARSYVVFGKRYYILKSATGYSEQGIASWYGPKFHGRKTANGETYNMHGISAAHKSLPLGTWVRVTNLENQRVLDMRINDRGPFVDERIIDLSFAAAKSLDVVGAGTARVRVVAIPTPGQTVSQSSSGSDGNGVVVATIDRPPVIESRPAPQVQPPVESTPVEPVLPVVTPTNSEPVSTATEVVTPAPELSIGSPEFNPGGFIQIASFASNDNATRMKTQLEQSGFDNVIIQTVAVNGQNVHRVRLGPLQSETQQNELLNKLLAIGLQGARVVSK